MSSETNPSSPQAASPPAAETAAASPVQIHPGIHWINQPLDDPQDSGIEDDNDSPTGSLAASIFNYRTLHGRTYHSDRFTNVQYWTPNDEMHMEVSDFIHHFVTMIHDQALFKAPLEDELDRVLDVGTGTGIWAIDFGDQHPNTQVHGTDISPIQPDWVPPNVHFEMDDATRRWMFPADHFDYVHMRFLMGSIADWPRLLREAYRCCKPGGYVESFEVSCAFQSDDGSLVEGSALDEWGKIFVEAGKVFGRPFDVVGERLVQDAFERAEFEDITEWEYKCPVGSWPQDAELRLIGRYAEVGATRDLDGWLLFVCTQLLGWSREQVIVYGAHIRNQLKDRNVHAYVMMRSVYGRKPGNGEVHVTAAGGGALVPGGGGTPAPGGSSTPAPAGGGTPAPGGSGTPALGGSGTPALGGSGTPALGGSGTLSPGGSGTPTPGGSSTPAPGGSKAPTPEGGKGISTKGKGSAAGPSS